MQSDKSDMSPTPPKSYSTTQPANSSRDPFAIASNPAKQSIPHKKDPAITSAVMKHDDCCDECCQCDSGDMESCWIITKIYCQCCLVLCCLANL
jgi:hypothetical protein